jgi:hypothetical protein
MTVEITLGNPHPAPVRGFYLLKFEHFVFHNTDIFYLPPLLTLTF